MIILGKITKRTCNFKKMYKTEINIIKNIAKF